MRVSIDMFKIPKPGDIISLPLEEERIRLRFLESNVLFYRVCIESWIKVLQDPERELRLEAIYLELTNVNYPKNLSPGEKIDWKVPLLDIMKEIDPDGFDLVCSHKSVTN